MERLTKYICERAHGAECVSVEKMTGAYCRGQFEATAIIERLAAIEDILGNDYDLDRLRELVEADRDGRCKILSVVKGEKCGTCRNFCRITGTRRGNCKVRPFFERRWKEQKIKFEPSQSHAACSQYVPEMREHDGGGAKNDA